MAEDNVKEDLAKEHFEAGLKHLKEDNTDRALRSFEKAYKAERTNPAYMSYYGLLKAVRGGEIGLGLELCTQAIKKEFYRGDFYLNLGKIYLAAGNKKGAIKVFKKGLRFEPRNESLKRHLAELGMRSRPVISALERSHPVNKFLGIFFRKTIPNLRKKK